MNSKQQYLLTFWKRYRFILVIYTIFAGITIYWNYTQGPEVMNKTYGPPEGRLPGILLGIIKVTLAYYYLIYHVALPLVQTRRWKTSLLQLLVFFTLLTIYEYIWDFAIGNPTTAKRLAITVTDFLVWELGIGIFMILFSIVIAIFFELRSKSERQKELEKQKLDAELSAIKYQINPHFLFNSLSFIYSKTVILNGEVAHAVSLLSEIMRYALEPDDDVHGKVTLSKEIGHMKNVIEMNQMRYNHVLKIQYHEMVDNPEERILPLIFITLVENAFKHGDLNDPENPLDIRLELVQKHLYFYIGNKKKKGQKEISNGIGLNNVKQRLQLAHGIRHTYQVKEDDNYYISEITINL